MRRKHQTARCVICFKLRTGRTYMSRGEGRLRRPHHMPQSELHCSTRRHSSPAGTFLLQHLQLCVSADLANCLSQPFPILNWSPASQAADCCPSPSSRSGSVSQYVIFLRFPCFSPVFPNEEILQSLADCCLDACSAVAAASNIQNVDKIYPGDQICCPSGAITVNLFLRFKSSVLSHCSTCQLSSFVS